MRKKTTCDRPAGITAGHEFAAATCRHLPPRAACCRQRPPLPAAATKTDPTRRSDHLIRPRPTLRPGEVAVAFLVVDESLLVRVPGQFAAEADGDHAKMAHRPRPVAALRVAGR